jgi:hypothetical protein
MALQVMASGGGGELLMLLVLFCSKLHSLASCGCSCCLRSVDHTSLASCSDCNKSDLHNGDVGPW